MLEKYFIVFGLCLCAVAFLPAQTLFSDQVELDNAEQLHVIHTRRGDVLMGKIIKIADTQLTFELREGAGTLVFDFDELSFVGVSGQRPDVITAGGAPRPGLRNSSEISMEDRMQNLFYSATGFGYRESKGEYRNSMLAYNYVEFGLGDNVSLGGGILIPVAFNIRFKTNVSIGKYVHLGAASNTMLFTPNIGEGVWSHYYGIASIGERRLFFNLTYGWGHNFTYEETSQLTTIGVSAVVSERFRFVGEFMIVNDAFNDVYTLPSVTAEYMGRRNKFQFGLTGIPDSELPFFPLLAFSQYL